MKTLSKQIEEIIKENIEGYSSGCTDNLADGLLIKPFTFKVIAEIISLIESKYYEKEFAEGCISEANYIYFNGEFGFCNRDYDVVFETLDELYQFWLTNIKGK
jgi:hypothetical protein